MPAHLNSQSLLSLKLDLEPKGIRGRNQIGQQFLDPLRTVARTLVDCSERSRHVWGDGMRDAGENIERAGLEVREESSTRQDDVKSLFTGRRED